MLCLHQTWSTYEHYVRCDAHRKTSFEFINNIFQQLIHELIFVFHLCFIFITFDFFFLNFQTKKSSFESFNLLILISQAWNSFFSQTEIELNCFMCVRSEQNGAVVIGNFFCIHVRTNSSLGLSTFFSSSYRLTFYRAHFISISLSAQLSSSFFFSTPFICIPFISNRINLILWLDK